MITNKAYVQAPSELAVTFDVDGFGQSDVKVGKYEDFSGPFTSFYHGFKLFYEEDTNLTTPGSVLPSAMILPHGSTTSEWPNVARPFS